MVGVASASWANAGGVGGGGGLDGSGGGLGGGGGGGGIVQSSIEVRASRSNVLRPSGHGVGRSFPRSGQYVFAGHGEHVALLDAAVWLLYHPRGHASHALADAEPLCGLKNPFGHSSHSGSIPGEKVPFGHGAIAAGSTSDGHANPGGHGVHCTCPSRAK